MNADTFRLGRIERFVRHLCVRALAWALGVVRATPLADTTLRRVVVLRFDPRLGNQVLLTPLLRTLRARLPAAHLVTVGPAAHRQLIGEMQELSAYRSFHKYALGRQGIVGLVLWLRRQRFDLCIDASNPIQPSLTHALVARLSGARHTLGAAARGFGPLRTLPVDIVDDGRHEIDLRLALLGPLGPGPCERTMVIKPPRLPQAADIHEFLAATRGLKLAAIHIGARLNNKRLHEDDYASLCALCVRAGLKPVLVWGPKERELAERAMLRADGALLAPPSDVAELCALFAACELVLSADTGPMHVAVALGRPTCGLFVSTEPSRFGHEAPPHMALDLRKESRAGWRKKVEHFLAHTMMDDADGDAARHDHAARRPPPHLTRWPHAPDARA